MESRRLNDFDEDLKFSSWIYRITHNEVISQHRKKQARPQSIGGEVNEEMLEKIASNLNVERDTDILYLSKNIDQVLSGINEKYREVIVLKFMEEKDYKEISDIIKKPMI